MKDGIKTIFYTWIPVVCMLLVVYQINVMVATIAAILIFIIFIFLPALFNILDWSWNKLFKETNNNNDNE